MVCLKSWNFQQTAPRLRTYRLWKGRIGIQSKTHNIIPHLALLMQLVNQEKPLWHREADSHSLLLQLTDLAAPTCCAKTSACCAGAPEGKNKRVLFPLSATVPSAPPTSSAATPSHHGGEMGGSCARLCPGIYGKEGRQTAAVPTRFPSSWDLFLHLHLL